MRVLGYHSLDFWCICCKTTLRSKKKKELDANDFDDRAERARRVVRQLATQPKRAYVFLQDPVRPKANGEMTIRRWELLSIQAWRTPLFSRGMIYIVC